jgi:beta-glucosidase
MRGGRAVAELLFGLIEPTGRLPISFALHAGQQPVYYNQVRGQHGDRYADLTQDPPFAFGEGLSFTQVTYRDLVVREPVVAPDEQVHAEVTLTNTGARPTTETVQVYVRDVVTSVTWADKELKAFRRVPIAPGEEVRVELALPATACTIVTADGARTVEAGDFELLVGPSSRSSELLAAGFTIKP